MRFIGSKQLLLEEIHTILSGHVTGEEEIFLDLFGGTNSVGTYFKNEYTVYSNDLLYFSYVNAKATIENDKKLTFSGLKKQGIRDPFLYLEDPQNWGKVQSHYYQNAYTPAGNAMYFTEENGTRIDFIRETIEQWRLDVFITETEYYYLLAALIAAVPFVSNITGTYGAYLKHWDKRALNPLKMKPLTVHRNGKKNKAFHCDANELVRKVKADIVYIDTPYNTRQYISNYHLLENIARNDHPELNGKTKLFDWSDEKSAYSLKKKAQEALTDLLEHVDATHVVLSYNTEGIIPEKDLIALLKRFSLDGTVEIKRIPYRKYTSKVPSKMAGLHELLLYIQCKPTAKKRKSTKKAAPSQTSWEPVAGQYLKSPLNYIGGKYKLLPQILPLFPKKIDTFVDFFSGGANVGINVDANHYYFNDMNHRINEMFRFFAHSSPDALVEAIKARIDEYGLSKTNEAAYLAFRKAYNENPNPLDLYVLVSYSYNYQFRFNNDMQFNNPFGRNRSQFSSNMERNLRLFVAKLQTMDATFTDQLFTEFDLSGLGPKDFVYLDPPYLVTTGNYNDGNRGFQGWGNEQEKALYDVMDMLTEQRVPYALSNVLTHKGKANVLLQEYIDASQVRVFPLDFHYNHSSYNTKGTGSQEILLTNYDVATGKVLKKPKIKTSIA